jgi:molecular chaperone HscA
MTGLWRTGCWHQVPACQAVDGGLTRHCLKAAARRTKEALEQLLNSVAYRCPFDDGNQSISTSKYRISKRSRPRLTARDAERGAQSAARRADSSGPTRFMGSSWSAGSTRMPQIQQAVAEFFGRAPLNNLNPDEVVAHGRGDSGQPARRQRHDRAICCCSTSFRCRWALKPWAGWSSALCRATRRFPQRWRRTSRPTRMGRRRWRLHVVQGERDLVADCRSLARFELRGIPAHGGRRCAHPRDLHGRCRRAC